MNQTPATDEQLETLKRLHAAATPGPWKLDWDTRPYERDGCDWSTFAIGPQHGCPDSAKDKEGYEAAASKRNADAAFIVAVVNAFTSLIARLADAEAAREHYKAIATGRVVDAADVDATVIKTALLNELKTKLADAERRAVELTEALRNRCECRFREGERVDECHFHACERHIRLDSGDPSDVTLLDRLAELESANIAYSSDMKGMESDLAAERMRLTEIILASQPIARIAQTFTDGWPDETRISDLRGHNITLGDFRRAAAALVRDGEKK